MGLFKRRQKEENLDLATVMARRGIPATANIVAMQATGKTKDGGAAHEYHFTLHYVPHGRGPTDVSFRQFMNELSLTGLAPGEQCTILYDRQDPKTVVVTGSPTYRIVSDGVAVKVEGRASGMSAPRY